MNRAWAPWRPPVGIAPRLSDAELVTLAVMQAHRGFTSETRWLRHVRDHLRSMFPYVPAARLLATPGHALIGGVAYTTSTDAPANWAL
jgi:hypothetical protein